MNQNEEIEIFSKLLDENRYDFCKLVYLIFPFGEEGHELEKWEPYPWQMEEWRKMSEHFQNPETRYQTYRLVISSGNGAAKTAFGAITAIILLYTQQLRCRVTANTDPQLKQVVWPEYNKWFTHARFVDHFFDVFGTSMQAKNEKLAKNWRIDSFTWNEQSPSAISGLHNQGKACMYVFEEAPGIPAVIWNYAKGAFTEKETIKLHLAFGNSDDPESKFEQNMSSPMWNSVRLDTRELPHTDKKEIEGWLIEAGGDEDDDDFRVRVRGLPRKSAKDSIIKIESVQAAFAKRTTFDLASVSNFPVILSCDPAWTGGDDTTIWYKQGHYHCMLEKYKLRKEQGETHQVTYNKLCYWERQLKADAVHIDQGEGTAVYTLAMNADKHHWILVPFSGNPTDHPDPKQSEYANIRAMMYYHAQKALLKGGVLDTKDDSWLEQIEKQLCWTKGTRHKVTNQKLAEKKLDIKDRVGKSPDIADGFVLLFAYDVIDKLPENEIDFDGESRIIGTEPYKMKSHEVDYGGFGDNLYD